MTKREVKVLIMLFCVLTVCVSDEMNDYKTVYSVSSTKHPWSEPPSDCDVFGEDKIGLFSETDLSGLEITNNATVGLTKVWIAAYNQELLDIGHVCQGYQDHILQNFPISVPLHNNTLIYLDLKNCFERCYDLHSNDADFKCDLYLKDSKCYSGKLMPRTPLSLKDIQCQCTRDVITSICPNQNCVCRYYWDENGFNDRFSVAVWGQRNASRYGFDKFKCKAVDVSNNYNVIRENCSLNLPFLCKTTVKITTPMTSTYMVTNSETSDIKETTVTPVTTYEDLTTELDFSTETTSSVYSNPSTIPNSTQISNIPTTISSTQFNSGGSLAHQLTQPSNLSTTISSTSPAYSWSTWISTSPITTLQPDKTTKRTPMPTSLTYTPSITISLTRPTEYGKTTKSLTSLSNKPSSRPTVSSTSPRPTSLSSKPSSRSTLIPTEYDKTTKPSRLSTISQTLSTGHVNTMQTTGTSQHKPMEHTPTPPASSSSGEKTTSSGSNMAGSSESQKSAKYSESTLIKAMVGEAAGFIFLIIVFVVYKRCRNKRPDYRGGGGEDVLDKVESSMRNKNDVVHLRNNGKNFTKNTGQKNNYSEHDSGIDFNENHSYL